MMYVCWRKESVSSPTSFFSCLTFFFLFHSMCGTGCLEDSNTRISGQEKGFASALLQHSMRKSEAPADLCYVHKPALRFTLVLSCSLFPDLELRV